MKTISKSDLMGKYIEFFDKDTKYRIGVVRKIHGGSVSVKLPGETKNRRVDKEMIIGQITHRFRREIIW